MGAGDLAAQTLLEETDFFDYKRTAKFAGIGLCIAVNNTKSG